MLLSTTQVFAETNTTAAINAGIGSGWGYPNSEDTNSPKITVSDSNYATQSIGKAVSKELTGTNYNFNSIPEGAVIESISVTINRFAIINGNNEIYDYGVYLVNEKGHLSTNKAKTQYWDNEVEDPTYTWNSIELSNANFTLENLKSPSFGIALSVVGTKRSPSSIARVDSIQITIRYTTVPTLSSVNITSDNNNKLIAKAGDNVTLSFTASEAITRPTVNLAGHAVTPTNTSNNAWKVEYTMASNDTEGKIPFNIAFSDLSGKTGKAVSTTTDSSSVIFDKTKPIIILSNITTEATGTLTTVTLETPVVSDNFSASNKLTVSNDAPSSFPLGTTNVSWTATDEAGNIAAATQTITIEDTAAPVITLNGAPTVTVGVGEGYIDAGATASDNYDGNITNKIVVGGIVDTNKAGSYKLTYGVTDANGNHAVQVTRTVYVVALPSISLDPNVIKAKANDVYGKMYFLSTASVTPGFNLVECGVVMSKDISKGLDLNNNMVKLTATQQSSQNQFYSLFNVSYNVTIYVRSYIICKDANGVIYTRYSNIVDANITK
jgi:hypothetical protein